MTYPKEINQNILDFRKKEIYFFLKYLNKIKIDYSILGYLKNFPNQIKSDVDIFINFKNIDEIKKIIKNYSQKRKLKITNIFKHEHNSVYFILTKKIKNNFFYICIDVCNYYTSKNIELIDLSVKKKIKKKLEDIYFYTLTKKDNFFYYFIKKIIKGDINNTSYFFLKRNLKYLLLLDFFNITEKKIILKIFRSNSYNNFLKKINMLKRMIIMRTSSNFINFIKRTLFRITYKTGFHVAFIGVDGSGKSTQISELLNSRFSCFFRGFKLFHIYNKQSSNSFNKYKTIPYQKKYGPFFSLLKIIYLFSKFFKFYLVDINLNKSKSFFILNDRCHYDVIVDPRRFGINYFFFFMKFLFNFLPNPDLTIYMDISVNNVIKQSKELPKKIILKNVRDYKKFIKKKKFIINVNSNHNKQIINKKILNIVYEKLNNKTKKIFLKLK